MNTTSSVQVHSFADHIAVFPCVDESGTFYMDRRQALQVARAIGVCAATYGQEFPTTVVEANPEMKPKGGLSRKDSLALIDAAYTALYALDNQSMSTRYREAIYNAVKAEEKGHRNFCPAGVRCGLTVSQACKLFTVLRIAEAMTGVHPFGSDLIDWQPSAIMAIGVYSKFPGIIIKAWKQAGVDPADVRSLDYAFLNDEARPANPKAA